MMEPQDPQRWVLPILTEQIEASPTLVQSMGQPSTHAPEPLQFDSSGYSQAGRPPWEGAPPSSDPSQWTDLEARIDRLVEEQVRDCIRPALVQAVEALVEECSAQISRELAHALKADLRAHFAPPPAPVVLGEDAVLVEDAAFFTPSREGSATPVR